MDGKIAWLLWPRHELSPVSACFLLAAFHNSFILWWRHGRTRCARVCVLRLRAIHHRFLSPLLPAFIFPQSYDEQQSWHEYNVGSVVPLIYERESPRPPRGQLQSVGSVGKTGRGRVRELRAFCVYGNYPGLLQRVIRSPLSAVIRNLL